MQSLHHMRWTIFTIAAVIATALVVHAEDKAAGAAGTWKWSYQGFGGNSVDVELKLKQDGEKLTGTISGFQGQENEIKDGTIKDDKVSFKVTRDFGGQTMSTTYTGTLAGDSLKGKSETVTTRDFDAKRRGSDSVCTRRGNSIRFVDGYVTSAIYLRSNLHTRAPRLRWSRI